MKKGDIIICHTPNEFDFRVKSLVMGDKYEIVTDPSIVKQYTTDTGRLVDDLVFDVKNTQTRQIHTMVSSKSFITLDEFREKQLTKLGI